MQKLVKKEYQIPFILVTSLFFLWGFAHAILDVLNKHFQDVMNISRAHRHGYKSCFIWDISSWLSQQDCLSINMAIAKE